MAKAKAQVPAEGRRRFPLKTALIMLGVLLLEGVAITAVFFVVGGPSDVNADSSAVDAAALAEQPVEELVVADKFQNTRSGRLYLYDTEVYVVVQQKHQDRIKNDLEKMSAAISTDIATIFRRADPAHLTEPTLATLTRQVKAVLDSRFKEDGRTIIREVLVRKCTQLPLY